MATTIKQIEATPAGYPELPSPSPLSTAAAALDADMVWQRLEQYCAHRWSERSVEWIVEGSGDWTPPLVPATITNVEIWARDDWHETEPLPSPYGIRFPGNGPYRVTATVGADNEPPSPVWEAFRRLAEYMAQKPGKPGAHSERLTVGSISLSHTRNASWMAHALQNSGAADLLRYFRRAA